MIEQQQFHHSFSIKQQFVMIQEYIRNNQALFKPTQGYLKLMYIPQLNLMDLPSDIQSVVTHLVINHCNLKSLEGIEFFSNLVSLNIKFNQIEQICELMRIDRKDKIEALNFKGNDIEFYGSGLFCNLVKNFNGLRELNQESYQYIFQGKKKRKLNLDKLLNKCQKVNECFKKTIKKQKIKNVIQQDYQDQFITERVSQQSYPKFLKKRMQIKDLQNSEEEESYQQGYSQYSDENKQNLNIGNKEYALSQIDQNISLGAISQIPMTKSVRASCQPYENMEKVKNKKQKKQLQIVTNNTLQSQNNVVQPTATFAMQRQKQQANKQNGFMFKNREKTIKYRKNSDLIEEGQYSRFTQTINRLEESLSYDENGLMCEERLYTKRSLENLGDALYKKSLMMKTWNSLKNNKDNSASASKCMNMPMKYKYYY